jgi:hypothetical protein
MNITVGDVFARKKPLGDPYDEVRVCGLVTHDGQRPNEYTIQSTTEFANTLQTDRSGLVDFCDRISAADPDETWEA